MARVYTGGTFDLFHKGHLEFLRRCSEFGTVVVALNSDSFVLDYKGSSPIMTFEEREAVLLGCRFVDSVVENSGGADSRPSILSSQVDLIVIGSDWARRDYYKQMGFTQDWLDAHGIGLCYLPYTNGISTTELKRRVREQ